MKIDSIYAFEYKIELLILCLYDTLGHTFRMLHKYFLFPC
jgi:hypothetical protein